MAKKKTKKTKAKTKKTPKKKPARRSKLKKASSKVSHLRQSKTDDFLEKLRSNNSMIEYFTRLTVLNPPAAKLMSKDSGGKREGAFVRLAHAREEFTAPVITKGKSARKPSDDDK